MAPKKCETSIEERKLIVKLVQQGKTYRETGEMVGRSFSTVRDIINKYKFQGTFKNKAGRGRKQLLNIRNKQYIIQKIKQDPKKPVKLLTAEVSNIINKPLSAETVRRVLRSEGFHGRIARKKPYISKINRMKRLAFAKKYIDKDMAFWRTVLFTDESKFNIFGNDGKQIVWRRANTALKKNNLTPTVKHGGGNCMVWGCMAANGVGNLAFITTKMDQYIYLNLLKENLQPSVQKLGLPSTYSFQQDNDPKHTAHLVKLWLLYNVRNQLKTPPQSPDINPIEHLWAHIENKLRDHPIPSKHILQEKLIEEWNKTGSEVTNKLVESMPRRLKAVIDAKGYPTSY